MRVLTVIFFYALFLVPRAQVCQQIKIESMLQTEWIAFDTVSYLDTGDTVIVYSDWKTVTDTTEKTTDPNYTWLRTIKEVANRVTGNGVLQLSVRTTTYKYKTLP